MLPAHFFFSAYHIVQDLQYKSSSTAELFSTAVVIGEYSQLA